MKNKKAVIGVGFIMAIFVAIMLAIFLVGGGGTTAFDITRFLSSIPTPAWVIFGILVIFKLLGGKK